MEFPDRPTDQKAPSRGIGTEAMGVMKARNPTPESSPLTLSHRSLSLVRSLSREEPVP